MKKLLNMVLALVALAMFSFGCAAYSANPGEDHQPDSAMQQYLKSVGG
jgi:hypothetical protein